MTNKHYSHLVMLANSLCVDYTNCNLIPTCMFVSLIDINISITVCWVLPGFFSCKSFKEYLTIVVLYYHITRFFRWELIFALFAEDVESAKIYCTCYL